MRTRQSTWTPHGAFWRLPYAAGHANRVVEILLPRNGTPPFKTVLFIHGGGWQSGSPTISPGLAVLDCLDNGIAIASIGYRFSDDTAWPGQMYDVKAAIRFLRANAARFLLDPTRFGLWGFSAGGTLAVYAALTAGEPTLRDASLGYADVWEGVKLCATWFAPLDFPEEDADFVLQVAAGGPSMTRSTGATLVCSSLSQEAWLLGTQATPLSPCAASDAIKNSVRSAHWVANRRGQLPAFRIQHGVYNGSGGDPQIPINQARRFRDALIAAGATFSAGSRYHYEEMGGFGHGGTPWQGSTVKSEMMTWLTTHL